MGGEAETNLINRRCTNGLNSDHFIKTDDKIESLKTYENGSIPNGRVNGVVPTLAKMNGVYDVKKDIEEITTDDNPTDDSLSDEAKPIMDGYTGAAQLGTDFTFKRKIVWFNAIGFLLLHIAALIGVVLMAQGVADIRTSLYAFFLTAASGMGVTMGAHRLFSHRAYKATTWLKVALLGLHTMAGQNCLYVWVRDHRQHHKYSDTDADPHNASRGFFFSHCGWLMSKKHPLVKEYGKKIDMSDMEADPWIMFQKKYYKTLYTIFTLLLPTSIPIYFWGEDPIVSLFATFFARTVIQLNFTWSVNSVAHIWGNKPYDKTMLPVESIYVALVAGGEGWHNYHHTFPWDYRAAELGMPLNLTTHIIDFFARFGSVYDRKFASDNLIRSRVLRTGDGTHHKYGMPAAVPESENVTSEDDHALRKYIVEKKQAGKMMMDQLEKYVKDDDFNNNINNNSCLLKKDLDKCKKLKIEPKDKSALNVCRD